MGFLLYISNVFVFKLLFVLKIWTWVNGWSSFFFYSYLYSISIKRFFPYQYPFALNVWLSQRLFFFCFRALDHPASIARSLTRLNARAMPKRRRGSRGSCSPPSRTSPSSSWQTGWRFEARSRAGQSCGASSSPDFCSSTEARKRK